MKCLVLGGTGFIGRHLVRALLAAGHRVTVFARATPPGDQSLPPGVRLVTGDFTAGGLDPLLERDGEDFERVFHLISTTLPSSSNAAPLSDLCDNTAATLRLLDGLVARPGGAKIVFISSGGTVYGLPRSIPITEDHPTDPLCAYGITKLAVEKYLALYRHLYGLDYAVIRLANPYGPGQRLGSGQGAVSAFLWRLHRDEPLEIWGDGTVVRDYLEVADAVRAIVAAADYGGGQRIFNIGGGGGRSLNELVAIIRRVSGRSPVCRYLPGRSCDVPVNVLAIDRARRELGWQPEIALEDGIAKFWQRMQQLNGK